MNESEPFQRRGARRSLERRPNASPGDGSARLILIGMGVLGLVLLVLLLPPISILGDGEGLPAPAAAGVPRVPEGLEALSRVFRQDRPSAPGPYRVTVPLLQPATDTRNVALYTYSGGRWQAVASVTLTDGGRAATAELPAMPANLAVLRRTSSAIEVSGWLPAGAQLDARAAGVLTTLNPVAYTPSSDGALLGEPAQLPALQGRIVPTVRASDQREADFVNTILGSPALREAHIAALVELAQREGYAGIDLDYRRVNPARRGEFSEFVSALAQRLRQNGRRLTLALPAPVRAGVNWDTGAYDWPELARHADLLKLTPDPDPSTYHQRMEEVLTFLRDRVDLRKVQLIVTRSSVEKGSDGLRALSLREGLQLASTPEVRTAQITPNASVVIVGKNIFQDDGATGILWDQEALAVAFSYPGRGGQRTVWLENAFSLGFRLDLARRYGLAGVALDDVSADPAAPALWDSLATYVQTGQVQLVQPNSALLKPTWQVQAGSSEVGAKGNLVWRAPPQPGAYDISLIVSDGIVRAMQKLVLQVNPPGSAAPAGTGTPGASRTPTPRP